MSEKRSQLISYIERGLQLFNRGEFGKAKYYLNRALSIEPNNPQIKQWIELIPVEEEIPEEELERTATMAAPDALDSNKISSEDTTPELPALSESPLTPHPKELPKSQRQPSPHTIEPLYPPPMPPHQQRTPQPPYSRKSPYPKAKPEFQKRHPPQPYPPPSPQQKNLPPLHQPPTPLPNRPEFPPNKPYPPPPPFSNYSKTPLPSFEKHEFPPEKLYYDPLQPYPPIPSHEKLAPPPPPASPVGELDFSNVEEAWLPQEDEPHSPPPPENVEKNLKQKNLLQKTINLNLDDPLEYEISLQFPRENLSSSDYQQVEPPKEREKPTETPETDTTPPKESTSAEFHVSHEISSRFASPFYKNQPQELENEGLESNSSVVKKKISAKELLKKSKKKKSTRNLRKTPTYDLNKPELLLEFDFGAWKKFTPDPEFPESPLQSSAELPQSQPSQPSATSQSLESQAPQSPAISLTDESQPSEVSPSSEIPPIDESQPSEMPDTSDRFSHRDKTVKKRLKTAELQSFLEEMEIEEESTVFSQKEAPSEGTTPSQTTSAEEIERAEHFSSPSSENYDLTPEHQEPTEISTADSEVESQVNSAEISFRPPRRPFDSPDDTQFQTSPSLSDSIPHSPDDAQFQTSPSLSDSIPHSPDDTQFQTSPSLSDSTPHSPDDTQFQTSPSLSDHSPDDTQFQTSPSLNNEELGEKTEFEGAVMAGTPSEGFSELSEERDSADSTIAVGREGGPFQKMERVEFESGDEWEEDEWELELESEGETIFDSSAAQGASEGGKIENWDDWEEEEELFDMPRSEGGDKDREEPEETIASELSEELVILLEGVEDLLNEEDYIQAMELLEEAKRQAGDHPKVKILYKICEEKVNEIYREQVPSLYSIPVLKISLNQLIEKNLNHLEGFIASRIDGTSSVLELSALSQLEEEKFLAILGKLAYLGIIEFKD